MLITLAVGDGEERLVGTTWKLVRVSIGVQEQQEIIDYSKRNTIFEFQGKNKLVVIGKMDSSFLFDNFNTGEHFYEYRDMSTCRTCLPGPNLSIDNHPLGQVGRHYFAFVEDKTLRIFCPSMRIGGEIAEDDGTNRIGRMVGGKVYKWDMFFIRLK